MDLNKLTTTAHRLHINEVPEINRYLIEVRPQLKLLPNTIDIEADDLLEAKKVNRELLLRRQLKPVLTDFDVVLIDTPPAMRAATINALVVADSIVIPIDSSSFALLGMNQLLKTIAAISETHNPLLRILVLTTMFNKRQETVTECTSCGLQAGNFYHHSSLPSPGRTRVRAGKASSYV